MTDPSGSGPVRVALVPGVLAFLPEYAGQVDPVAEVRAAALAATAWLADVGPVVLVADEQGARVGGHLLRAAGAEQAESGAAYLVVANGSARRRETSPGYVDERAVPYDDAVGAALRGRNNKADSPSTRPCIPAWRCRCDSPYPYFAFGSARQARSNRRIALQLCPQWSSRLWPAQRNSQKRKENPIHLE